MENSKEVQQSSFHYRMLADGLSSGEAAGRFICPGYYTPTLPTLPCDWDPCPGQALVTVACLGNMTAPGSELPLLTGDVAQRLQRHHSNPKTWLRSAGGAKEGQLFCPSESTLMQTCLYLTPLRVYGTHPHFVYTLKIPHPSVVKE